MCLSADSHSNGQGSVKPPSLVAESQRVVPTLVVSGHPFCSFSKEFLSGNIVLTTFIGYVTMGTGYTPIQLIQLNQCHSMCILILKYVLSQHFSADSCVLGECHLQVQSAEPLQITIE